MKRDKRALRTNRQFAATEALVTKVPVCGVSGRGEISLYKYSIHLTPSLAEVRSTLRS